MGAVIKTEKRGKLRCTVITREECIDVAAGGHAHSIFLKIYPLISLTWCRDLAGNVRPCPFSAIIPKNI